MQKIRVILLTALLLAAVPAYAQMSDSAIITYLTEGVAAGKTEAQLGNELLSKGVSIQQIQRLLKTYRSGNINLSGMPSKISKLDDVGTVSRKSDAATAAEGVPLNGQATKPEREEVVKTPEADSLSRKKPRLYDAEGNKLIYGHNMFNNPKLTFEPNENAATPEDYVLGPDDEVVIDIWGTNEATIRKTISPEGRIILSQIGPIQLSGLTVRQATAKIRRALQKIYSSDGLEGDTQFSVSLGKVRTVRVSLVGELAVPGTYRLSSFSSLFNAIYRAGGITPVGSLRAIEVMRNGKRIASVDLYAFLFEGRQDENVTLQEGDVIVVPAYRALVSVEGGVKRPMFYEMKEGESLDRLLAYAGGFSGDAYRGSVKLTRKDGRQMQIFTVEASRMADFPLQDGDAVEVAVADAKVFANMVEIRGAVYRPGLFELGKGIATVSQLIDQAGGLLDDAFLGRAQIIREKQDRSLSLVPVPLKGIVGGTASDILLKKNDVLIISNTNEIEEKGDLTITGYVSSPGKYQYAEHTSVEDLILLAGGLSEGASSVRVDVSRRINNPASKEASDTLARIYTFGVKDGLFVKGEADFELEPYDVVAVRRSPTYVEQRIVTVSGEVTFPGQYTLVNTNERVSDLVRRAGGPTPNGNIRGGMLKRKINQYERNVRTAMARMVKQGSGRDSLDAKKIMVSEIYTVGLELDKALEKPGSDYDMVLRDGDELIIPATASTVRVQGEVLYPNTVHFISGKPVRYYVHQAGGFSTRARRSKTYVVYMNGTVAVGSQAHLEPGCEIIVPSRPEKDKLTASEWLGIGTAAASITTMVATIINMLK